MFPSENKTFIYLFSITTVCKCQQDKKRKKNVKIITVKHLFFNEVIKEETTEFPKDCIGKQKKTNLKLYHFRNFMFQDF